MRRRTREELPTLTVTLIFMLVIDSAVNGNNIHRIRVAYISLKLIKA